MLYTSPVALLALGLLGNTISATVSPCSCTGLWMDCSYRNATALPQTANCNDAKLINLKGNLLEEFPDGLESFEVINAANNKIKRLPSASQLHPETETLELDHNEIAESSQELSTLSSLKVLHLDSNRLTSLDFLPLQCNLFSLDVSENAISILSGPIQNCSKLEFLSLEENQITTIPNDIFSKLRKLKYLQLDNNKIASIPDGAFSGLKVLDSLSLQMNNITLSSGSFQGLSQLRTLDLSFNNLRSLPANVFSQTPMLVKLDLSGNSLTALNSDVFAGLIALQKFLLSNNKLTAIPTLRNCCDNLEELDLSGNNIRDPSEETVRTVLRGKIRTKLGYAAVRSVSLRWALSADNISTFVDTICWCGGLRRAAAAVHFCVNTRCGGASYPIDWVAAVRNIASS